MHGSYSLRLWASLVITEVAHNEIRPRKDKRGVDLISDALPFGRLWYTAPDDATDYAKFRSRSHDAVIGFMMILGLCLGT